MPSNFWSNNLLNVPDTMLSCIPHLVRLKHVFALRPCHNSTIPHYLTGTKTQAIVNLLIVLIRSAKLIGNKRVRF